MVLVPDRAWNIFLFCYCTDGLCRDAFRFAYDMAELGTDKQTQRERSADQGGKGPISWPQNIKEISRGVKFPQEDLKGLNYIDSFLKLCGIVFREPRN